MKNKLFTLILLAAIISGITGCKQENPTKYENDPAIYISHIFYKNKGIADSLTFSFVDEPQADEYTLNLVVLTQGDIDYENDRKIIIRQKIETPLDPNYDIAESEVDFVPLNDPSVTSAMIVPKGDMRGIIPITIKKNDKIMTSKVELQLEILPSEDFRLGMEDRLTYKIKFSCQPEKPYNWDWEWYWAFGYSWGPVKHMFILEKLGPIDWNKKIDTFTEMYYQRFMRNALNEYNLANPGAPLSEAPDKDGNPGVLVSFY